MRATREARGGATVRAPRMRGVRAVWDGESTKSLEFCQRNIQIQKFFGASRHPTTYYATRLVSKGPSLNWAMYKNEKNQQKFMICYS